MTPGAARQTPAAPQQPPVFRAGVELVTLDVSVLDKDRQPVRGLMQADFTVLENGKRQSVEAFAAIDLPDSVPPVTPWANAITPDVTSNEIGDNHRIFILLLDDLNGAAAFGDLWAIRELKKSAVSFIDKLGPNDLAAVVFTQKTRFSQDLTSDHAKLIKAVDAYPLMPAASAMCDPVFVPISAILRITKYLSVVPQRRKSIVYFGGNLPAGSDLCQAVWTDVFREAQQNNVNIYPIDSVGLRIEDRRRIELYQTVAENTGGKAVVNSNDFEPGITQIFRENSSYYLLAYRSTGPEADGKFRKIEVKVNRPGLDVWTRKNYWSPKAPKPPNPKEPPPAPPSPAVEALADILPLTEMPLRAVAAPFASTDGTGAVITVALGFKRPLVTGRLIEEVSLLTRAFTSDGEDRGQDNQTVTITVPPARRGSSLTRYETLSSIAVAPGRHELRLSAHSLSLDKRGSVYIDVDVPDFAKAPLSLSGVVVSVLPGVPAAPIGALQKILPVIPTTERTFGSADRVSAFVRVYQGGKEPLAPAMVAVKIVDGKAATVFEQTDKIAADQFTENRGADYRLSLPTATLGPGEYFVTFEAAVGKNTAKRDVRFTVK